MEIEEQPAVEVLARSLIEQHSGVTDFYKYESTLMEKSFPDIPSLLSACLVHADSCHPVLEFRQRKIIHSAGTGE